MKKSNELLSNPVITQPTQCLGLTFANEEARRAHFLALLRAKLQEPDFREIAGFPQATDEAILALSDPPYYTACPNPWLAEFLKEWTPKNNEVYHREPFTADVSEGKNDPIYNAHSYHTKVPHKAIMRYILHYTEPGDVVFDGFCGTGMTGVAAQLCGNKPALEALNYRVLDDGTIEAPDENDQRLFKPFSKLGSRRAILNDLSPAAMFLAYNYNMPVDVIEFELKARRILQEVELECGWMYKTLHRCGKSSKELSQEIKQVVLGEKDCPTWISLGRVNYTVWSDIFVCPECAAEVVFWKAAVDEQTRKVNKKFPCPHCFAELTKRTLDRSYVLLFDKAIGQTIRQAKQVPVLINYSMGKHRFEKIPDEFDLALLEKINNSDIPYWFPTERMIAGDESRRNDKLGITHQHHFYTKRNLWIVSAYLHKLKKVNLPLFQFGLLNTSWHATKMRRFNLHGGDRPLSGTYYVPSLPAEGNIFDIQAHKISQILRFLQVRGNSEYGVCESTATMASIPALPDGSIDYIFLDPPFGANLMYSELNFLWEAWLQVFTNNQPEAIVNKTQGKSLADYQTLMNGCFKEAFRILKPGRWMTVEFSNTQACVWNMLQTALQEVGFIIANVSALDKKHGSFKAVTTSTAVKQDLIISAYKPDGNFKQQISEIAGNEADVWEFVRNHLKYLPLTKSKAGGELEFISEREPRILYDRTVAYFLRLGYPIPLSSQAFQAGLQEHFNETDGMIFLWEQFEEYEKKRKLAKQLPQMELFVSDERSAIDWLHHFLKKRPSTRQEIHPKFTKLIGIGWKKHEVLLELDTLLEFNFLKYNGKSQVPSQIHGYLSRHFKDCRNLTKDEPLLQQRATERWYVADPSKAQDLEKLRENHLLREFKQYCQTEKRLKEFRLEVMRAGFKHAWGKQKYQTIIEMAAKIPEKVLYEDEVLLQLYDLAMVRVEGV